TAQPTPEPTVQPTPEPTPQPEKVETTADVDGTQVKVSADSKVLPDAELKVSSVSDEVKNKADQAVKNKLDPEAEILEILDIKAVDKTTNQEKQPEGGTVSVEMSLNEKYKDNGDIKIVHFDDSKDEVNVVDNAVADKDNKTVSFEASHFSYYAAVKVPKASVSVSGVNLKWDSLKLYPGDSTTLQATVSPENATNKNVLWTSSDDSIVSVDTDGKITAHKEGTATITVTTEDGNHFDTTLIEVKNQEPKAASVSNQTYNDGGSGDGNVIKKLAATVTGTNPDTSIRQAALMNGDVPAWMIPSIIGLFAGGGILIGVIALIKRKRSE
ncbi:Ig-like domain (group 2), partial [Eubacterium maltosivorans]